MKFSIKDFFKNVTKPQETSNLVTFTDEILNGKLQNPRDQFFCLRFFFYFLFFEEVNKTRSSVVLILSTLEILVKIDESSL